MNSGPTSYNSRFRSSLTVWFQYPNLPKYQNSFAFQICDRQRMRRATGDTDQRRRKPGKAGTMTNSHREKKVPSLNLPDVIIYWQMLLPAEAFAQGPYYSRVHAVRGDKNRILQPKQENAPWPAITALIRKHSLPSRAKISLRRKTWCHTSVAEENASSKGSQP